LISERLNPLVVTRIPGGVLLGIFVGGVPPASPNPDQFQTKKLPFSTPVLRPSLKKPYPFSGLTLKIYTRFQIDI